MGVSLALLAQNAFRAAGRPQRVRCVSRFRDPAQKSRLEAAGIDVLAADLLEEETIERLPDAENVIFMVGVKFGTAYDAPATWAANAYLPGRIANRYPRSRLLVFSTGNVYPLVPVASGGSQEEDPLRPVGEYAQSALARERVFAYFSRKNNTPMLFFRLNYAIDMRYGVLLDVAMRVYHGQPIRLENGYVNVIWQGDANTIALRALEHARVPPYPLNVTGPEVVSVRWLAETFGKYFNRRPVFRGSERKTALLSHAGRCLALFGPPRVPLETLIEWTAAWVGAGLPTFNKPTKFEVRTGRF